MPFNAAQLKDCLLSQTSWCDVFTEHTPKSIFSMFVLRDKLSVHMLFLNVCFLSKDLAYLYIYLFICHSNRRIYKDTCRWMHVFQREKRASLNCISLWASLLVALDDISALVYCTCWRQTHTCSHKYTFTWAKWVTSRGNSSSFKLNAVGVQCFHKYFFFLSSCTGSWWFLFSSSHSFGPRYGTAIQIIKTTLTILFFYSKVYCSWSQWICYLFFFCCFSNSIV